MEKREKKVKQFRLGTSAADSGELVNIWNRLGHLITEPKFQISADKYSFLFVCFNKNLNFVGKNACINIIKQQKFDLYNYVYSAKNNLLSSSSLRPSKPSKYSIWWWWWQFT